MKTTHKTAIFAVLAALLVFQQAASPARPAWASASLPAADITVGAEPACTTTTIADAVARASSGGRVLIDKAATFLENITITKSLTLVGGYTNCVTPSSDRTTIDGSTTKTVLTINAGLTVALSNLNITNGKSANGGGLALGKGAIVTGTNLNISNNTATAEGGGIYADTSTLTLNGSTVSQNSAANLGGGIRLVGGALNLQANSIVDHNLALALQGGGIASTGPAAITITNSTLTNNSAKTDGGAIYVSDGTLDFTGWWNVSSNSAGGSGGGVAIDGTCTTCLTSFNATLVKDSLLSGNSAGENGGAVFAKNGNAVRLYAVGGFAINISNNHAAASGGAFYANAGAFFDVWGEISAVTNVAGGDGGVWYLGGGAAIWMTSYGPDPIQILGNQANNGGAIFATSSPQVEFDEVIFGSPGNGNTATTGNGGAISVDNSSFTASNDVFQYNTAAVNGGAIASTGSTLTVGVSFASPAASARLPGLRRINLPNQATGCVPVGHECSSFHHNSASGTTPGTGFGGAIYAYDSFTLVDSTYLHDNQAINGAAVYASLNTTQVINSLLHHNIVTGAPAAILHAFSGTFKVSQDTITDNTGIGFSGEPAANTSATNTISWNNSLAGYDGIGAVTCSIGTGDGIGALNLDPKFYGNGDYRPWRGSPAIDACPSGLAKDINNYTRPYNLLYDMGAFEYIYKLTFIVSVKK